MLGDPVLGLDELGVRVFRAAARQPGGAVADLAARAGLPSGLVDAEVRHQRRLGLLRPSGRGWAARDPVTLLAESHAETQARTAAQRQQQRDERTALARSGLFADYLRGRHSAQDGLVDVLHGHQQVWARLAELVEAARADLRLLVDGVPAPGHGAAELTEATLRAAERGVAVAAVWTPEAFAATRDNAAGAPISPPAWVRRRDHVPMRALVADHTTAVVPVSPADLSRGAFVLAAPELVAAVSKLIDVVHSRAEPVVPPGPGGTHRGDGRRRAVIALLAEGHDDDTVAERLGLHPNTVRRDVLDLMAQHGARTRFALAALLARGDLLG